MQIRHVRYLAPFAVLFVLESGAAWASPAGTQHTVHPGESIQAAVNAAKPGDTITIMAGTYRESIDIAVSDLTLRGVGEETVISPTYGTAETAEAACAKAGNGICVTGTAQKPVTDVTIRSLTVQGFAKSGIATNHTDRTTIRRVLARNNGHHGISQERSTRAELRDNEARDNGESGIFLANMSNAEGAAIDTKGTVVRGNQLTGNRIGVTVRRLRQLSVESNHVSDNCGGIFLVGDESKPRAGALTVRRNDVYKNNRYCPPNTRLEHIQGTGILLTGVEDSVVTENWVVSHSGNSPMSGGIVLFGSKVGTPNANNVVNRNDVLDNRPSDLHDQDKGPGNAFSRNTCAVSLPAGRC
ncbi:right-handed parallel beta-helix repeat-containing protein [Streptomyces sp. LX-29]|uniref:right-handed parallel beta-helix repeat-containing protein n=1 Tax=Streptomyces sp. LX-29 TaxID=2900152 RepID=UPI00240D57DC|nr:right-handed parallel beta-helix repeat-containing protein [Streptomyces sp. LX-29]WFB06771.1 right-handed parallel beta-helix repeat-containing protein [Streptomyces sp. LX-29]